MVILVTIYETDTMTRVQILDKTVCISHSTYNTFGKGMNPIILALAMGK